MIDGVSVTLPLIAQQRPPDSPFGDLLGWIIVFFVIVWPIIKGLLDNAAGQRKKFDERQRRQAGAGSSEEASSEPRRSRIDEYLEEMIAGPREAAELDESPPPRPASPRPVPTRPASPRPGPPRLGPPRLAPAPATERERTTRPSPFTEPDSLRGAGLGASPFDRVALEEDSGSARDRPQAAPEDDPGTSGAVATGSLGSTVAPAMELTTSGGERNVLRRIQSGLTPWQAAFVLREVIGPPAANRDLDLRSR